VPIARGPFDENNAQIRGEFQRSGRNWNPVHLLGLRETAASH